MYEINKNISTISCAGTIIQQIGRKGNRENIFEAKISLARKWEKPPKSEKTADLLLYEKFMRSSINPFYEGVSRKCGLLFMKKCIMRGNGSRVSPWAGRPWLRMKALLEWEIRNEKLGIRSDWWLGFAGIVIPSVAEGSLLHCGNQRVCAEGKRCPSAASHQAMNVLQ